VLSGVSNNNIDVKGRCVIPSAFRHEIGNCCVIFTGFENNIMVFSTDGWDEFKRERLRNIPYEDVEYRDLEFLLFDGAQICDIDKQGRILIPKKHLEHAALEKEAVIIGFDTRFEIWSKENYEKRKSRSGKTPAELLQGMLRYRTDG
jgi:MraZ protein